MPQGGLRKNRCQPRPLDAGSGVAKSNLKTSRKWTVFATCTGSAMDQPPKAK